MAIKNEIAVYINGMNKTARVVLPFKIGNFLDERLDEAHLSLRGVKKENYVPLTPVEVVITNTLYWGIWNDNPIIDKQSTKTRYFVVANDVAWEVPVGSGFYNHDLYLIEITKIAECFVIDTITYTNDLGRIYTGGVPATPKTEYTQSGVIGELNPRDFPPVTPTNYTPALPMNEDFEFVSAHTVFPYNKSDTFNITINNIYTQTVYIDNEQVFENEYSIYNTSAGATITGEDKGYTVKIEANKIYKVKYVYHLTRTPAGGAQGSITVTAEYEFSAVENKLPLKQWTVADVINRLLDVCEPIRKGEKPRFRLNAEQAVKFDKILAPQFSFTKQTLRECLKDVGGFIHGEPRLTPVKDESGQYYYEVSYEMYASQEKSGLFTMPYIKKDVSQYVNNYVTHLDSSVENLVNQLDKMSGVIIEPYRDGAKTVRTETLYARIEDTNMLIPTQYPIYSVEKLEYVYVDGADNKVKSVDITPWLFEETIYNSRLSSYASQYPYSKMYAIYYTQGVKNIKGLNFKVPKATNTEGAWGQYSIINIIRQAMSNNEYMGEANPNYPGMSFRVTYTPFYNARVSQTKVNYKDFSRPAALIYNQTANVIESRYYGEHLKGAVARLGNVEKTLTYYFYRMGAIPKAGQMYDENYYISAVALEFYPTIIKCTVALSRDFNRISGYIGINSQKRYSEISQNQAVERNTLWKEYIVVGTQETPDRDCLMSDTLLYMIADTFIQYPAGLPSGVTLEPLTNVTAWGTSYKGNDIPAVSLPVISSAFGNSISFSWEYEDNYSAGAVSSYQSNKNVKGYFQNNAPYTDYYGRIFYYNFDLQQAGKIPDSGDLETIGTELPQSTKVTQSSGFISTVGKTPYILRKDNREKLQCNFQIDFVANQNNIIIGSALASYCPAVRGADLSLRAKLYVFPTELNKFTDHVEAYETDVLLKDLPSADITIGYGPGAFYVTILTDTGEHGEFPGSGKSWAIVTAQTEEYGGNVEDEFGNISPHKIIKGGDLLLGQNIEVTAGQAFTPIYFTKKREIFDKTVWKDQR